MSEEGAGVLEATPAAGRSELGPDGLRSTPGLLHRRGSDPVGQDHVPTAVTGKYLPALDGLRGTSMSAVTLYHLGLAWAAGFYLSVDMFFVLSGFLITSLALEEWAGKGHISLSAFWGRRARRLLPALFVCLALVVAFVAVDGRFGGSSGPAVDLSGLRGDGLATMFYVANWHLIFTHQSYFAQFAAPSPLNHTWTLAIEEQFYLVWPPVLVGLLLLAKGNWRRIGLVVAVLGALASGLAMALLFHGGDPSRVYYGTDTRAFDLFAGIAVAFAAAARRQPGPQARRILHVLGPIAAVVLAVFWATAGVFVASGNGPGQGLPRDFMYRGGFLFCAALMAIIVADVRQVHMGPLGKILANPVLRWLGVVSYGLYLFHYPVIIFVTPERTGLGQPWLDLVRIALTVGLAAASYYLIERPVRRHKLRGFWRYALGPVAAVVTAVIIVVATLPAVALPPAGHVDTAAATGAIPGAGGYQGQQLIKLPKGRVISAAHPLRIMVMGDSVPYVAYPGIAAAFGATGRAVVIDKAIPGFGLTTAHNWPTEVPILISQVHPDVIAATWSWDDDEAEAHPAAYQAMLESAVREMLAPGNGVAGVVFLQFPKHGPFFSSIPNAAQLTVARDKASAEWNRIEESMVKVFPGRVMYLPLGPSVLLNGHYTSWLPPANKPHAPMDQWVRVRMVDRTHMCPAGVVRYASAMLSDFQGIFGLPAAKGPWYEGDWVNDPRFSDPPGSCPDDHPPG